MKRNKAKFSCRFVMIIQILLISVLNCVLTSGSYGFENDLNSFHRSGQLLSASSENEESPDNSNINPDYNRAIRDADDKTAEFLKHTTIIAHIANGIALQAGLMNGTIPIEDLVGEILRFGAVRPFSLIGFKSDKIDEFATKVKTVASSLDQSAIDFEKDVVGWNQIVVRSQNIGNLENKTETNKYLAEARKLTNSDFDPMSDIKKATKDLNDHIANILDKDVSEESKDSAKKVIVNDFSNLFISLGEVKTAISDFSKKTDTLMTYKLLSTGPEIFKPFENIIDLLDIRASSEHIDSDFVQKVASSVKSVAEITLAAQVSVEDTSIIQQVVEGRAQRKPRSFTPGFPNGVLDVSQLAKEIHDPWVSKILHVDVTHMNTLKDGLSPLFKVNEHFSLIHEALKPTFEANVQKSLLKTIEVQQALSTLPPGSVEAVSKLEVFQTCASLDPGQLIATQYRDVRSLVDAVKAVSNSMNAINVLRALDLNALEAEFKSFQDSLGFTDIKVDASSVKEVPKALENLKTGDAKEKLKSRLVQIDRMVDDINVDFITATFIPLVNTKDTNDEFSDILGDTFFVGVVTTEKEVHKCLKDHVDTAKKAAAAVQVVQKLRELNVEEIDATVAAAKTISKITRDLEACKELPDKMESWKKETTPDLNQISEPKMISDTMGQSVDSLRSADTIKRMEPQISQLKLIDVTVASEIHNIRNSEDKSSVKNQWGDHKTDIAQLETFLEKVKEFDKNLDLTKAKSLGEYGDPLNDLATVPDVKIQAEEKSKALGFLIAQDNIDPKVKADLEESKKTLDNLATLDLQFSSHQKQFQSAPGAFKALHDFLTGFLTVERKEVEVIDKSGEAQENLFWLWILICLFAVAVIIIAFVIVWYRSRRITDKVLLAIIEWCKKQAKPAGTKAIELHLQNQTLINQSITLDKDAARRRLTRKKLRYSKYPCNMSGVDFLLGDQRILYNANRIICEDGLNFFAAQGPLARSTRKDDTREDFLAMAMVHESDCMVMIGQFEEATGEKTAREICARYFMENADEEMTVGRYKVKTLTADRLNQDTWKRTLQVTDTTAKDAKPAVLTHYQYLGWPMYLCPDGHDDACTIMRMIRHSKKPIIVHCSTGLDQTMAFIGLHFVQAGVKKNPQQPLNYYVTEMARLRYKGLQNPLMIYWMQVGVVYMFFKDYEDHKTPIRRKLYDDQVKGLKEAFGSYSRNPMLMKDEDSAERPDDPEPVPKVFGPEPAPVERNDTDTGTITETDHHATGFPTGS